MNTTDSPRTLLSWVLRRGRQLLRLQVQRAGAGYQVSISPCGRQKPLYVRLFRGSPTAFQRHAALVAAFREAGWTSIAYR
jgi:hypothetical protein